MRKNSKTIRAIILGLLLFIVLLSLAIYYVSHHTIAVMQPAGTIANQERNLIYITLLLSALIVIPVYVMTVIISVRYRATNRKATYKPDWDNNNKLEFFWWAIPMAIIAWLSVITWITSHSLDPYRPIASSKATIPVQVIALDWKWLFIYPSGVASVNQAEIPVGQPVDFHLTSDSVMNSFWVPQLGGQIYAMPGMTTQLHLEASRAGSFFGSPANISGTGFARMDFTVKSVSPADYASWLSHAAHAHNALTRAGYTQLAKPSDNYPVTVYSASPTGLFNGVVDKYMAGMPMSTAIASQGKGQ